MTRNQREGAAIRPIDYGISRAEMLIALSDSFWATLKNDLIFSLEAFRAARRIRIDIEDIGHRLIVRGDQVALDVTMLPIENEAIRVRHASRQTPPNVENIAIDIHGDAIVLRDSSKQVIDVATEHILAPFFRRLSV